METETLETTASESVVAIIDATLNDITKRDLVSSAEMADILLDMRLLLTN